MDPLPNRRSHQLRKGRHEVSGTCYFVTTSTFNRKRILSSPQVAQIIFNAFQWLEDKERIRWICVMVMPDHIHAVIQPGCNQTLGSVLHSLKSFTAKEINALRGETGSVWQEGYYERGIRGEEALNEIVQYCYGNPVRKGLVKRARDYPYWWCKYKME